MVVSFQSIIGIALVGLSILLAFAESSTRRELRSYRVTRVPLFIGIHNFMDPFDFENYRPEARSLVVRLRRQFLAFMVSGVLGASLFFLGQ